MTSEQQPGQLIIVNAAGTNPPSPLDLVHLGPDSSIQFLMPWMPSFEGLVRLGVGLELMHATDESTPLPGMTEKQEAVWEGRTSTQTIIQPEGFHGSIAVQMTVMGNSVAQLQEADYGWTFAPKQGGSTPEVREGIVENEDNHILGYILRATCSSTGKPPFDVVAAAWYVGGLVRGKRPGTVSFAMRRIISESVSDTEAIKQQQRLSRLIGTVTLMEAMERTITVPM
jgi:hypothetical protein